MCKKKIIWKNNCKLITLFIYYLERNDVEYVWVGNDLTV